MSNLKKFEQFMKEDPHRQQSELDKNIEKEVKDLTSDDLPKVPKEGSIELSSQDIEKLRKANVNESLNTKTLKEVNDKVSDRMRNWSLKAGAQNVKIDDIPEERIQDLRDNFTKDVCAEMGISYDQYCEEMKDRDYELSESLVLEGVVKQTITEIQEILDDLVDETVEILESPDKGVNDINTFDYASKIFDLMSSKVDESKKVNEEHHLDSREGMILFIQDHMEHLSEETVEKMYKMTEDELPKEMLDEYREWQSEYSGGTHEPKRESDEFIINPDSADFKLIKEALGETTTYPVLKQFLKENFPGWEDHTSSILDAWGLIKLKK